MKIFIGADHRGFKLKEKLIDSLVRQGHEVIDEGAYAQKPPCDYPKISEKVATAVVKNKGSLGILACMTGIGHSIAANKVPGARAALCYNKKAAVLSREHNDANILIVGAKFVKAKDIFPIVSAWLKSQFQGGRHLRRVSQIKKLEQKMCD